MRWCLPVLASLVLWMTHGAPAQAAKLAYAKIDIDQVYGQHLTSATAVSPASAIRVALLPKRVSPSRHRGVARDWHLSVDGGVTADSNITNVSGDRFLDVRQNGTTVPVELDPALRARSGVGRGASVSAGVKLRLSDGMAIAVDADGHALDHQGGRNDDISFLLAAGPELTWSEGRSASVQVVAGQSWYGGRSNNAGVGLRVRYVTRVTPDTRVSLSIDGRSVSSGYGRAFAGEQANVYLGASKTLSPIMSASLGLYARSEWLRADEYSNLELGLYGGVSRYFGPFTGSLSFGASRTRYDAPLLYLSDARRQDWRFNAGVQLTTRAPIGLGLHPTVGYSYGRTDGSIDFFDADRHRVRVGARRTF